MMREQREKKSEKDDATHEVDGSKRTTRESGPVMLNMVWYEEMRMQNAMVDRVRKI